jgi:ABC-type multidrug transport system ATPase subunit
MKQKLALSCALIHRPSVLFLDEPTTGVDAVSRKEFWDMLKNLKNEGITILVSTPYMDEASLCDRVALIQEGKIMSVNTPQGVIDNFKSRLFAVRADNNMFSLLKDLQHFEGTEDVYAFGEFHHLVTMPQFGALHIKQFASSKGYNAEVKEITPVIEDCFISLMKSS